MATQQEIDDAILAQAIATQVAMVAESEINGWELLRLFQLANAAKRELRRMYHKSIAQLDDLFRGYSMALDDIGKIGEASGLNSSLYMTHSPRQVAGMVLKQANQNTKRIEALERISADKVLSLVEQEIKWCNEHKGDSAESEDFEKGFVKGLEQAKFFINKVIHQV